ncbi:hypothetical protein CYMTET_41760 [Cymbomonas tetramitiformis]|uniref:Uncharacterized protein n=1 Tax=Cymbomonas tetramitiformis TaxID=36881 RepID=A0AAE0F1X1_9CHLO|nr:hypothetical protein CYMTET_41760 [Cymbomonas tetramitiformis]
MQALGSRAAECGLEEHQQGAQVLPYTDNFLVSLSSKVEALRERELASRVLRRLGWNARRRRGFWPDEFRYLHITRLELEAIYKTVQSYLRELISKVVQLFCKNQVVVAMLPYFTLRNPELIRRMRRLWILLDLNGIKLQARYIKSEANKWDGRRAAERDRQPQLAQGCMVKAYRLINDAWCIGTGGETTVDGKTPESYDDGDTEFVDMSKEKYEVVSAAATVPSGWDAALQER